MQNQYDLTALLRAIGVKGPEGFIELLGVMQPVLVVGDLSSMGPSVIPPMSVMGGFSFGLLGEQVVFQFTNQSKGGSFVRFNADSNGGTNEIVWAVVETPMVPTAPTALTNHRASHQRSLVVGTLSREAIAPLGQTTNPSLRGVSAGAPLMGAEVYVPLGSALLLLESVGGASSSLAVSTLWRDVPVPPGADAFTATLP